MEHVPSVRAYVEGWRLKAADEQAEARRRREQNVARMRPVARMLAERFGIRRVVLFGSAALGTDQLGSDVDLAVEGLAPAQYFAAFHALEAELGLELVDLVEIERAGHLLRAAIDRGIVLHG